MEKIKQHNIRMSDETYEELQEIHRLHKELEEGAKTRMNETLKKAAFIFKEWLQGGKG